MDDRSCFVEFAARGDTEKVRKLLRKVSPEQKTRAIILAYKNGHMDTVDLLNDYSGCYVLDSLLGHGDLILYLAGKYRGNRHSFIRHAMVASKTECHPHYIPLRELIEMDPPYTVDDIRTLLAENIRYVTNTDVIDLVEEKGVDVKRVLEYKLINRLREMPHDLLRRIYGDQVEIVLRYDTNTMEIPGEADRGKVERSLVQPPQPSTS